MASSITPGDLLARVGSPLQLWDDLQERVQDSAIKRFSDFLIFVEVLLQRDSLRLLEKRIELLEKTLRILAATSDSEHAEEEK